MRARPSLPDGVRCAMLKKMLLGNCSEAALAQLARLVTVHAFSDGTSLIAPSETPHQLFIVVTGKVRVCVPLVSGKEVATFTARTGEPVGLPAVIEQGPSHESATACGKVVAMGLWGADLKELLHAEPKLWVSVSYWQCRMLRCLVRVIEQLGSQDIRPRLAHLIASEAERVSSETQSDQGFVLRSSQQQLSRLLGVSRQTVSKHLRELEKQGILSVGRREVWVRSTSALHASMGVYSDSRH